MLATTPEGPVESAVRSTGHVTIQMKQFHGSKPATGRNIEPAKVVIPRAKTHW